MEKKIQDYLHLYLGCKVKIVASAAAFDTDTLDAELLDRLHTDLNESIDYYKPILRPLSDMTEEDVKEWADVTITPTSYCIELDSKDKFGEFTMVYPDGSILSKSKDDGDIRPINGGELFRLLLSKHFDLFGLIESGLAIDSTTLKTPTP